MAQVASSQDSKTLAGTDDSVFPLLDLAPEIMSRIVNLFPQSEVLTLRLVNRRLRDVVDELYEFRFNIYDEVERLNGIRKFKCEKITVWKLTSPLSSDSHLFDYPSRLKAIEIHGIISEENLRNLIAPCVNLERFSIVRRASYPWILNSLHTPELMQLKRLRSISMNCEDNKPPENGFHSLPLMDCFFPSLTNFDIVKGFRIEQYFLYVASVLSFIGRHWESLRSLSLYMLPRTNLCFFPPNYADLSTEDFRKFQQQLHKKNKRLCDADCASDMQKVQLTRMSVTTQGYMEDLSLWSEFLENQSKLQEFRFDWSRINSKESLLIAGFPWSFLEQPILKSSSTLSSVELNSICVYPLKTDGTLNFKPINLSVFSACVNLSTLCLENVATFDFDGEQNSDEKCVMISGSELPDSLMHLRLRGLPMQSSDLVQTVFKCKNLEELSLIELGRSNDLGVTAEVLVELQGLDKLKSVQVVQLNRSSRLNASCLQQLFNHLGVPGDGNSLRLTRVEIELILPKLKEHKKNQIGEMM